MSFIRRQEENIALSILRWRYRKLGIPMPSATDLQNRAAQIVNDAHRIARERGRNVMAIIKELANDLKGKEDE